MGLNGCIFADLSILKLESNFFGRCRFLRIGNFHLVLPKSIWAFFRVSTVVTQLQNWLKWLYLYRFCQFWSWEANFLVDIVFYFIFTVVQIYNPCPCPAYPMGYLRLYEKAMWCIGHQSTPFVIKSQHIIIKLVNE